MGFLDNEGLTHFWGRVKDALAGKQDTITAGDGVSQAGSTISVTTPVRGIVTQAEFDALPEDRRNKGMYVISGGGAGGGASPSGLGGIFRHMVIFQESGVFNPADYGLKTGDLVSVTVVGGGGGGGVSKFRGTVFPDSSSAFYGGDAGKDANPGSAYGGKGGLGYGAGGGGCGVQYDSKSGGVRATTGGSGGGGSGFVTHAVVRLSSLAEIPVTVGAPGTGGSFAWVNAEIYKNTPSTNGGASSFGEHATANGGEAGQSSVNTHALGGNGFAKGGNGSYPEYTYNLPHYTVCGGDGGSNGSPGQPGTPYSTSLSYTITSAGGGGGGGYIIPFSALEVETIGELVPGAGVVVVAW